MFNRLLFFAYIPILLIGSCKDDQYIPKPRGFQRIDFPKHIYQKYWLSTCNYGFDLPLYAEVKLDPYPLAEECWYNVNYLPFGATLHLSYRNIENRADLFKVINDSREMVYKHVMRADETLKTISKRPIFKGYFTN